jgi:hypothetical protein
MKTYFMRRIFAGFLFLLSLSACVNTKKFGSVWIPAGQLHYERITDFDKPQEAILKKKLTKSAIAQLFQNSDGSFLPSTIHFIDSPQVKLISSRRPTQDDAEKTGAFFPLQHDDNDKYHLKGKLYSSSLFKYMDIRPVAQAIAIPFKFRFRISDAFPSTASSDFSVGFAIGEKFTNCRYRKFFFKDGAGNYSPYNDYTSQWTFSPGVFIAPTAIDLDSAQTEGSVSIPRTVIGATAGVFFVAGYNSFNLGAAIGFDKTFGSGPKNWVYSGKPWLGIIFAVDIFK